MTTKTLHDLLTELDTTLRNTPQLSAEDRALLAHVQAELTRRDSTSNAVANVKTAPALPSNTRDVVTRLQAEHPRLASLFAATLDALSDLGV
jgi:hypothetical protein